MPQKKKTANKKTNKKSHKKHLTQKQNIIFQSIPNYASGQMGAHQYNKDHVQFAQPATPQTHTDNIVGELVGKLMNKIENDGNKEVQQYSKEIQPINNNNYVNVYKDGIEESKTDKKPDETPSEKTDNPISDGIKNAARTATEDFFLNAGAGLASIAGAALGASGWRNRKAIRTSISSFPTNAKNRLSSIRESFRNPGSYQQFDDAIEPSVRSSQAGSQRASNAASPAVSRRPSNASSQEGNIIDSISEAVGISPERRARATTTASAQRSSAARPRSNTDSASSAFYGAGRGTNLADQFDNTLPARSSATRRQPALNSENRALLERTLRNQGLDPHNLSPVNQDILRGRQSGIQQRDVGASTRAVRAQTGEPHTQLQTPARRGRGRPQTNEYARPIGPARPVGRPRRTQAQAALSPQAQPILQTPARGVTRNISNWKSN